MAEVFVLVRQAAYVYICVSCDADCAPGRNAAIIEDSACVFCDDVFRQHILHPIARKSYDSAYTLGHRYDAEGFGIVYLKQDGRIQSLVHQMGKWVVCADYLRR